MTPQLRQALETLARHSDEGRVMDTLLNFCRIKAARGELIETDAFEVYDIVLAAYDRKHKRSIEHLGLARLRAVKRIRIAINSGSK